MTGRSAIKISGLKKSFGPKAAVAGMELDIPAGSFFGLLGPNGAGKSTTIAMATGLLRPDEGTVQVGGSDVWNDAVKVREKIGVVPEQLPLFDRLTGVETLEYVGRLRGLRSADILLRSQQLLELLDLTDSAQKTVGEYSTGMRKKVALAAAIIHSPEVLFLDEPFESVDPVSVLTIRDLLTQLVKSGATVLFSSHVLETVEEVCDYIAIMDQGRLVVTGPVDTVTADRRLSDVFVDAVGVDLTQSEELTWLGSR